MKMSLHKLFSKLRRQNKGQYLMLGFCIFLSVLLLTAFALMYFGPTVQDFLPEGGDTRKLAVLLIGVTAVGCTIFTLYASSLFFRFKSREYGIFLALGTSKKQLNPILFRELGYITVFSAIMGLVLAIPASYFIWKLFEFFIVSTEEMHYQFGFQGFLFGIFFSLILALLLFFYGARFVKKSNIMDILRTQHKTELVKLIPSWTGKLGIFLTAAGLFTAMVIPFFSARVWNQKMPAFFNVFYLFALVGIYLLMLSIVAQGKAGRRKEKYYKNLVFISMMRFKAKSTTRNMCVITLLLFTSLFAAFYGMLYSDTSSLKNLSNQRAFTLHFPARENQVSSDDIRMLADKYQMDLQHFSKAEVSNLVISWKHRDLSDNGEYFMEDTPNGKLALFFPASLYEEITGQVIDVPKGNYKVIVSGNSSSFWEPEDGLYAAFNPSTETSYSLQYAGTLEFDSLANISSPYTYVISDEDYSIMTASLDRTYKETLYTFDVADYEASYPFAEALAKEYISHATELSDYMGLYDFWEDKTASENNEEYGYAGKGNIPEPDRLMMADWKYAPSFNILTQQDFLQGISVYVMLCLYIFIIALSAVTIIAYVRSISAAEDNKELFQNLEKLGGSKNYRKNILRKQLARLFQYPIAAGCLLAIFYALLMSITNDGQIAASEIYNLLRLAVLSLFLAAFLYLIYRKALKKACKIVKIKP